MQTLHRNTLVWPSQAAWKQVLACGWDAQARTILSHWQQAGLPVVVCTQRGPHQMDALAVGLPAPTAWGRRKLAFSIPLLQVERSACFPTLEQLPPHLLSPAVVQDLLLATQSIGVPLQVYGSFGWQALTGLDYLRDSSDLDVRIPVASHAQARALVQGLGALALPLRLDGELAFDNGSAVAWREYQQWLEGRVQHLLVKSRLGAELLPGAHFAGQHMVDAACV